MKASHLVLALLATLPLVVSAACGGGEPAVTPATPTVTPIPFTPAPTPIPFTYNPDYPIYKTPQSDLDLLGPERTEQIRQVHRLLSEPLQRRLDAWGATFRAARTIDDLLALPEYAGVTLPEGMGYLGLTRQDNRTYGVVTSLPSGERFPRSYGHELGHIIYGLLNEDGILRNAEYYLRTTVGTDKVCPVRGVPNMESLVETAKANPGYLIHPRDWGELGANELSAAIMSYEGCRDYLSQLGAIGVDSQYTGRISLDLTPLISRDNNQMVSISLDRNNTSTTSYAPSSLALRDPDEFFAEAVTSVIGGILGADYATVGESSIPLEDLKTYNPEYFTFFEGLLTNANVANQFMLSEQELLEIRYGLR